LVKRNIVHMDWNVCNWPPSLLQPLASEDHIFMEALHVDISIYMSTFVVQSGMRG
jgi:hypothetical protein